MRKIYYFGQKKREIQLDPFSRSCCFGYGTVSHWRQVFERRVGSPPSLSSLFVVLVHLVVAACFALLSQNNPLDHGDDKQRQR